MEGEKDTTQYLLDDVDKEIDELIKKRVRIIQQSYEREGCIYQITNLNDAEEFYIGCHEGIDPIARYKTHQQQALCKLQQPIHKRIFREGLKYFDVKLLKKVIYIHPDQLEEEEKKMIEELKPVLNGRYILRCPCGKVLKQEDAIFNHKQKCQSYIERE